MVSQGFCRFGKEGWSGEVRALVLRAVDSWAPGGASPIPPHWSLSGARLEIPDNSQNQRWGLEVTQQLLTDLGEESCTKGVILMKIDQVLASLQRKQKALNPLISKI